MDTTNGTELTVIERAAGSLGGDAHIKQLIELSTKYRDIVEIKNADGRAQVHSAGMSLLKARTATEKIGKATRDEVTKFSKAVTVEENRRLAIIAAEEKRLFALRDEWDAIREAERLAAINAEAERVAAISHKINQLRSLPVDFHNRSADEIKTALDDLESFEATEAEFAELVNEAHSVKIDTIAALKTLHAHAVERAEEVARLAAERAELETLRASEAERARVAAVERAEQDVRDRVAREAQEAADRETKRKADEAMAAERDAHERKMADDREALRIQQDALNAERQRIADEAAERQRAIDAEFAAEQARILVQKNAEAAEQARRERQDFVNNGPDASDIITIIANAYVVDSVVALNWLNMHAWDQVEVAA